MRCEKAPEHSGASLLKDGELHMTTCAAQTPVERRSCRSYLKRAAAVMLCCVLVFMFAYQQPRARASAGAATATLVAAGGVVVAPVLAVAGVVLLAAVGVAFVQGAYGVEDTIFYGSAVYDAGYKLAQYFDSMSYEDSHYWQEYCAEFEAAGGYSPGMEVTVPAELAEAARQWAVMNYGEVVAVTENWLITNSGQAVVLSSIPSSYAGDILSMKKANYVGTYGTFFYGGETFTVNGHVIEFTYNEIYDAVGCKIDGLAVSTTAPCKAFISSYGGFLVSGFYNLDSCADWKKNYIQFNVVSSVPVSEVAVEATIAGTESLETVITQDKEVALPDLPTIKVEGYDVPAVGELTSADVLVGEGTIDPPIETNPPIVDEGTMVGDIAIEDVAAVQDDLGAFFMQKFPFCIPWDLTRAVKLLAAPAEAPRWEVDLMAPIEHRVGSWAGDTTIVLDMGEYEIIGTVCRWTSLVMFAFSLISATKRLIWTA